MRILIVEDHSELRGAIKRRLVAFGNSVDAVNDCDSARQHLDSARYNVAVFDRMLPDGDVIELLKQRRKDGDQTPILLLTALSDVVHRVEGLAAGADDYLVKPFAMEELMARIIALSRRKSELKPTIYCVGNLEIDTGRRDVRRVGVLIPLRAKEYAVLELLASRKGRTVSKNDMLDYCWDTRDSPGSNVEETVVASLRRKLGPPTLIHTKRGLGYFLSESREE